MNTKYPWNYDTDDRPILDTPRKLIDYASAVLHEPANPKHINFNPYSLKAVELYYGQSQPISLGLVNGIAAETIKRIRQAQDSL